MKLIDTHCHIHETEFFPNVAEQEAAYQRAINAEVAIICVATSEKASREAIDFVGTIRRGLCWASIRMRRRMAVLQ